jgi:hypothetical protein
MIIYDQYFHSGDHDAKAIETTPMWPPAPDSRRKTTMPVRAGTDSR